MQKYEYKVSEVVNYKNAEQLMNDMAREGWKVISTVFWANVKFGIVITFEREIENFY